MFTVARVLSDIQMFTVTVVVKFKYSRVPGGSMS